MTKTYSPEAIAFAATQKEARLAAAAERAAKVRSEITADIEAGFVGAFREEALIAVNSAADADFEDDGRTVLDRLDAIAKRHGVEL